MKKIGIIHWLREKRAERLGELYRLADETRRRNVGDEVHLRGLIEVSNCCVRDCAYCGLRAGHRALTRYRMNAEEILGCVRKAVDYGYGTVVLQSGEDYGIATEPMAEIIRRIKSETNLAVTLSFGERPNEDLACWRAAGADRYLLRFETSDAKLYGRIHPPLAAPHVRPEGSVSEGSDRIAILRGLGELGYEVGSGVMIGIPGQTYESLAEDIELFRTLDLDMIGVGPYLPHPNTPLGRSPADFRAPESDQVPNTEEMTYKVLALARLACPRANIPSTTALATLNTADGREFGLQRGANVVMPNLTPLKYRALYEIYPGKACIAETAEACQACLRQRILSIGRKVGTGPGGSAKRRVPAETF
jgi:biotin synthase